MFSQGSLIYLRLLRFLKKDYFQLSHFPEDIKNGYSYHSPFYNRSKQYIHANHFFGELLCMIRGKKMSKEESINFALLSSCAPVFDDFFEKDADYFAVRQLMHHPNVDQASTDSEKLAAVFFSNLLNKLDNKDSLLEAADQLFDAQLASKTQINESLSLEELLQISINKGGFSGLMYASLLENVQSENFNQLAFYLGAYGQLMDDVFDLFDDAKAGIRTFANQSDTVKEIRMIIEEQEQKIIEQLDKMHLLRKNKEGFKQVLAVFSSIIEIAIRQFEKNESEKNLAPNKCLQSDRKYWIIDMEKASNIWKLFSLSAYRI